MAYKYSYSKASISNKIVLKVRCFFANNGLCDIKNKLTSIGCDLSKARRL